MKKKGKKYYEDEVELRSGTWGGQLIKFEKKSFGWDFQGSFTAKEFDGVDDKNLKPKFKVFKKLFFIRHKPYTNNFLFKLTEFIEGIIAFFRKIYINLFPLILVASIAITCLMGDSEGLAGKLWDSVLGILFGLIAATFIFSLLGRLWIKVFKIEENLETSMTEAGYDYDSYE